MNSLCVVESNIQIAPNRPSTTTTTSITTHGGGGVEGRRDYRNNNNNNNNNNNKTSLARKWGAEDNDDDFGIQPSLPSRRRDNDSPTTTTTTTRMITKPNISKRERTTLRDHDDHDDDDHHHPASSSHEEDDPTATTSPSSSSSSLKYDYYERRNDYERRRNDESARGGISKLIFTQENYHYVPKDSEQPQKIVKDVEKGSYEANSNPKMESILRSVRPSSFHSFEEEEERDSRTSQEEDHGNNLNHSQVTPTTPNQRNEEERPVKVSSRIKVDPENTNNKRWLAYGGVSQDSLRYVRRNNKRLDWRSNNNRTTTKSNPTLPTSNHHSLKNVYRRQLTCPSLACPPVLVEEITNQPLANVMVQPIVKEQDSRKKIKERMEETMIQSSRREDQRRSIRQLEADAEQKLKVKSARSQRGASLPSNEQVMEKLNANNHKRNPSSSSNSNSSKRVAPHLTTDLDLLHKMNANKNSPMMMNAGSTISARQNSIRSFYENGFHRTKGRLSSINSSQPSSSVGGESIPGAERIRGAGWDGKDTDDEESVKHSKQDDLDDNCDESIHSQTAEQSENAAGTPEMGEKGGKHRKVFLFLLIFLLVAVALGVGLGLGLKVDNTIQDNTNQSNIPSEKEDSCRNDVVEEISSDWQLCLCEHRPIFKGVNDDRYHWLKSSLSNHLGPELHDISSCEPSHIALLWLTQDTHENGELYDEISLVNRFVLTLSFFSWYNYKEPWINNEGWMAFKDECKWFGITCNDKKEVVSISLQGNQLSGSIPTQLGLLSQLSRLQLSSNALTGTIPEELSLLNELVEFDVENTALQGPVPKKICDVVGLKVMEGGCPT